MGNELKSLDAVEMEIKARYNGKYTDVLGYQASERATRKAITNIFRATADFGTCDDVLSLIGGKEYRRTAFTNYLNHENYISPIIKACYS
ncbi:hypothetical protein [Agathobacter rectalis]|uniref:Uncharacterized protein n=1 Tax=Agathobacter rectalis TaxID=39491 RepID=A0A412RQW7_9FIRM|nr:hypothetical protein [Agathobacter rectalis]RGU26151.1 hypothetical protein DWW89_06845 [Agathobacter rectalis]